MRKQFLAALLATGCPIVAAHAAGGQALTITPAQTLEGRGITVVVDQDQWSPIFFDEKNGGIQVVLHGQRVAADGDVRLNPTPEQWDPVPGFIDRSTTANPAQVVVRAAYKDQGLSYRIRVSPEGSGFRIAVDLDRPLPANLAGKAGFNLDFLPTVYFGKAYYLDGAPGLFPRDPTGPMATDGSGDPLPLASGGHSITLAPDDPLSRVTITSDKAPLALYDARNRA